MTEEFTTEFFWQKCQKKYRTGSGTHPTSENGKLALLTSGRPVFQQHTKRTEGSDTTHASHAQKALSAGCTSRNFDKSKKITQPSGAAAPRNSDAHKRIAVPKALCVLREYLDRDPKGAKFAVLIPGHAGFPNRVKRSEGSDTTPIRNATCFGV